MISRRRILSRSRDDLNSSSGGYSTMMDEEEDVWYQKEMLYKDHVQEVLNKWTQIDDEIWAKVICLERNRRVAKAYARASVLTINGSNDGFDGYKIGLCGFDNPMRDAKTEEVKRHVGHGVKIKMDEVGNILIKRVSKCNVYLKNVMGAEDNSLSAEALKLPNGAMDMEKPVKLFDMKKFQQNVSKELTRAYPDRRKLEYQCVSSIVFVKNEGDILECPCWVMIINIVAMEMLKSKLPPIQKKAMNDMKSRPRIPIPDEDPYSVPGNGTISSSNSRDRGSRRHSDVPPKLPPRDGPMGAYHIPKPDYDGEMIADENKYRLSQLQANSRKKAPSMYDDPYYCGLRARIPNFAKPRSSSSNGTVNGAPPAPKKMVVGSVHGPSNLWGNHKPIDRSTYASPDDAELDGLMEDPYASIYGRLPGSFHRGFVHPYSQQQHPREVYVGEWDGHYNY